MQSYNQSPKNKLYKSSRFRIFVHLMAGFSLMATAENSGLNKLISAYFHITQSTNKIASPLLAMILSGAFIVTGYFLSLQLTTAIDKSGIKEIIKMWITFLLPIIYFTVVFPLVKVINTLTQSVY